MCTPECLVVKIVEEIVGEVIQALGHQLGYLFQYKKNMQNLEVELKGLQENEGTISTKIDVAKTRGEVIDVKVSNWQNRVGGMTQEVETFIKENAGKESFQCLKFSCPDFISRYKLSKLAKAKTDDVKSLSEKAHFDTISQPAPPPLELQFPNIGEYMNFDSRTLVFDKIMEALRNSEVNVIGVYGIGGVGKTTMVEKIGEQVGKNGLFDEIVMAVVSQDTKVAKIQGVLADRLRLKPRMETEEGRAGELWNRLNNGKRNLVILDDVWKQLNLKDIGIPITDGNKGCKVVLTSRNRRVLKEVYGDFEEAYRDFPIEVLSEEDAWNLFEKKVGNIVDSHGPLHDIAREVCKECGGLPVAIRAVAAALKGKSLPTWKRSLDKLKKSMLNNIKDIDTKLFISLKLSYEFLNSKDEKWCFLLCCSFPEDAQVPVEELARHYMTRRSFHEQCPDTFEEAREIVDSMVDTLKTSCLLLDGEKDDFVKMHDVVRDVAILIAKEERAILVKHGVEEWPETETYENFSAISLRFETIRTLPDELVCPELHTLMLEHCNSVYRELSVEIPDKFFRWTEKLTVLKLNSLLMSPRLPSSLEKLMELRMLCLNECELGDITMLKYLKNKLEVLSLRGSDIKALPHEVGELTRLRLLDLGDCRQLEVIPNGVISKLVRLEELHIPFGFACRVAATSNEERSKLMSLDELTSLTRLSTLDTICVGNLRQLPVDLFFQNLIKFYIQVGIRFLHEQEEECSLQGVMTIGGMCSDDDLNIWERLLGKPKWFNNLTQLQIVNCSSLKYLFTPCSARELQQLQRLKIERCEILESVIGNEREKDGEIIENVMNFSQLKVLELRDLPCLVSFYPQIKKATTGSQSLQPTQHLFNEKVAFPTLKTLEIHSLHKITGIWDMQAFSIPEKASNSPFSNLTAINVYGCSNLVNVVKGFSNMQVRGTEEIKESQVANYILQFPQLRSLELNNLAILSSFSHTSVITQTRPLFNDQVAFDALEELTIISVPNITEIWDKNLLPTKLFGQFRSLTVEGCEKLINVVPSHFLPLVLNIESLKIGKCPAVEVIVVLEKRGEETQEATNKDIIQFPKMTKLTLEELEYLKGFCAYDSGDQLYFNMQVVFPMLSLRDSDFDLHLDVHSQKIFKEAISGNKEMMDAFASYKCPSWMLIGDYSENKDVLEEEDVSEDKDEEAHKKEKEMMEGLRHHYRRISRAVQEEEGVSEDEEEEEDVSEDEDEETHKKEKAGPSEKRSTEAASKTLIPDEDEETPKKAGPTQKSLTKAAIKSLAPDEDDLENEDNSRDEDEETPKKAGTSERKPIESATKAPIMGEDDKESCLSYFFKN